jgi:hypothetical protein
MSGCEVVEFLPLKTKKMKHCEILLVATTNTLKYLLPDNPPPTEPPTPTKFLIDCGIHL